MASPDSTERESGGNNGCSPNDTSGSSLWEQVEETYEHYEESESLRSLGCLLGTPEHIVPPPLHTTEQRLKSLHSEDMVEDMTLDMAKESINRDLEEKPGAGMSDEFKANVYQDLEHLFRVKEELGNTSRYIMEVPAVYVADQLLKIAVQRRWWDPGCVISELVPSHETVIALLAANRTVPWTISGRLTWLGYEHLLEYPALADGPPSTCSAITDISMPPPNLFGIFADSGELPMNWE
ncbi:hypothetical protein S40288_10541 [Stachybotrys chartarum IBT 40288]|nr:hypothetical protein S40288_10541 [Stachybotrys chartarum IBT 40288]